jgi:hypothetical protein
MMVIIPGRTMMIFCHLTRGVGLQLESLRAATEAKEITFKVAYGLPLSEQLKWGLFVSHPRNIRETDKEFPEPGLLLLNPDGELVIVDYSNSPFARPDLRILVEGTACSLAPV